MTGRFVHLSPFDSRFVRSRRVDVWLPPEYDNKPYRRFPVIYAQDGQNLFDATTAYVGVDWGLHATLARLAKEDSRLTAIVVGIWNTPDRIPEYMPQKPLAKWRSVIVSQRFADRYGSSPRSDDYLRFIAVELKAEIDSRFRTRTGPESTILLGSSMGGLLSLYGFCEYSSVFGKAVCMSTSWTIVGKPLIAYLRSNIPDAVGRRIYFDHGDEAQIGAYEKLQHQADMLFARMGYRRDVNFMSERFPGAPHSEQAWKERVDVPLRFVLRTSKTGITKSAPIRNRSIEHHRDS